MQCPCPQQTQNWVPTLSLIVAALAVFFGPIVTWKLTTKQIKMAREAADKKTLEDRKLANKQIVAPMRQAWIEKLRKEIASFLTLCNRYAMRGTPEHNDLYDGIRQLILVIRLSLNSTEQDHLLMIELLEDFFVFAADDGAQISDRDWGEYHEKETRIVELAREIFSTEWKRVKSEDAN